MKVQQIFVLICLLGALNLFAVSRSAVAEDNFAEALTRAQAFKAQGKFSQALAEISWATSELQKLHSEKLKGFFPSSVKSFTAQDVEENSALGLISIDRQYVAANGVKIKASLSGAAAADGAAAQGMAAFAGMAQFAAMAGGGLNLELLRIKDQRAQLMKSAGELKLIIPLSSGSMLQLEASEGAATKEQLVSLAEAFDLQGLNTYLLAK